MKIYFAASISGGRDDIGIYSELISHLKKHGEVLTEHIGNPSLHFSGEKDKAGVHDRDMVWLLSSDVIIAEVSTHSTGVGYEIGRAVENHKKILCLYRIGSPKTVSGMIYGNKNLTLHNYTTVDEAKIRIDKFLKEISQKN